MLYEVITDASHTAESDHRKGNEFDVEFKSDDGDDPSRSRRSDIGAEYDPYRALKTH